MLCFSLLSKYLRKVEIEASYFFNVGIVNVFFFVMFFFIRMWIKVSHKLKIYELEEYFAYVAFVILCLVFLGCLVMLCFYDSPLDIFCFVAPWLMMYYSYSYVFEISIS